MSWPDVLSALLQTVVHDRLRATDDGWTLVETGFDPDRAIAVGSNFMVGNGYMGYRGTTPDQDAGGYVALVVSDTYDRADGRWTELCTVPDPLHVQAEVAGTAIRAEDSDLAAGLDLRTGEFGARLRQPVDGGDVEVDVRRFASPGRLHLLLQRWELRTRAHAGIRIAAGIDGNVWSLNGDHFRSFEIEARPDVLLTAVVSVERKVEVAVACVVRISGLADVGARPEGRSAFRVAQGEVDADHAVTVESFAAVFTSNDTADPVAAAVAAAREAAETGYDMLREVDRAWWDEFWRRTDVEIEGPVVDQVALRFAAYHNRIATPAHTDHLPIGARGLSCQAYQGAAFWDQEVFTLPVFLFTEPDLARNLLVYRHRTLAGARRKAAELGYAGAFYAWISGDTGDELCPDVFFTDVVTGRPIRTHFNDWQIHVAPDVVTTIERYVDVTGDEAFLVDHGAEVAFEVARFLHSFVRLDTWAGTYHCIRLLGPDEWHENVDDNAFTNYQVHSALAFAVRTHEWMADRHPDRLAELSDRIGLADGEPAAWADIVERLFLPAPDPVTGVVEQFAGFHGLEDIAPEALRSRALHPDEYWGGLSGIAARTKVAKQADVVMLMWLHEAEFTPDVRAANFDHYEPYCAHGSTLSASAHAMVAARLGRTDHTLDYYRQSALVDLANTAHAVVGGTFIGGIHTAACAGTYQIATQGIGGLGFDGARLTVDPALPPEWHALRYPVAWRGAQLSVAIDREDVTVTSAPDSAVAVPLRVVGTEVTIAPGESVTTPR